MIKEISASYFHAIANIVLYNSYKAFFTDYFFSSRFVYLESEEECSIMLMEFFLLILGF